MNQIDIQKSPFLGTVILQLLTVDSTFKDQFKQTAPSIAADIESASTNPNCTCRTKVATYVSMHADTISAFLYQYLTDNNMLGNIENLFNMAQTASLQPITGRVAKTSIKDWPEFTKNINQSNFSFKHMSTSIVGEDVYVFFM
jgi:hypothetical protein